ncbi:prepilin-type N-terminal cleavage/methylation domain-containing protein [Solibacillus sp. FSL W7-1436]|uniref:prepilin-type N-terminal cleavage/methylation domain-containing protein n=1 Tax=Solibacillus sp. FSL W7-1436 TaxID=2921705 RepID=UPI0040485E1C
MNGKVKSLLKDEKGFTLMEMLIVLFIFLVVNSAILYFSQNPLMEYTEKQVINQNEMLIRMTQLLSIEKGTPYTVEIINCQRIQVRERNNSGIVYDQRIARPIAMYLSTPNNRLVFNTKGNVQAFGQLTYHFENEIHQYSVNIGKARILEREVFHEPGRPNSCRNTVGSRHFILPYIDNHSAHI